PAARTRAGGRGGAPLDPPAPAHARRPDCGGARHAPPDREEPLLRGAEGGGAAARGELPHAAPSQVPWLFRAAARGQPVRGWAPAARRGVHLCRPLAVPRARRAAVRVSRGDAPSPEGSSTARRAPRRSEGAPAHCRLPRVAAPPVVQSAGDFPAL